MGYFDGLVSGSIKKDAQDRSVFYPMGVLARGRVLPDAATEQRLRKFMVLYYQIGLPVAVLTGIFLNWKFMLVVLPVLLGWFVVGTRQILAGCPYSDEKLTLKEGYTNSAAAHNLTMLWVMFGFMVLAVLFCLFMALAVKGTGPTLTALGMGIFFAACGAAIGYMISTRRKAV